MGNRRWIFSLFVIAAVIISIPIGIHRLKSELQKELGVSYQVNRLMEAVFEDNHIQVKEIMASTNGLVEALIDKSLLAYDIIDTENNKYLLLLKEDKEDFILFNGDNQLLYGFVDNSILPSELIRGLR